MNYTAVIHKPNYRIHGVPVTLDVGGVIYPQAGQPELRAIEMTDGVDLGGLITIETTRPMASIMYQSILALGLTEDQIDYSVLTMNNESRKIEAHKCMPSPKGKTDGEIYLFLTEA